MWVHRDNGKEHGNYRNSEDYLGLYRDEEKQNGNFKNYTNYRDCKGLYRDM